MADQLPGVPRWPALPSVMTLHVTDHGTPAPTEGQPIGDAYVPVHDVHGRGRPAGPTAFDPARRHLEPLTPWGRPPSDPAELIAGADPGRSHLGWPDVEFDLNWYEPTPWAMRWALRWLVDAAGGDQQRPAAPRRFLTLQFTDASGDGDIDRIFVPRVRIVDWGPSRSVAYPDGDGTISRLFRRRPVAHPTGG